VKRRVSATGPGALRWIVSGSFATGRTPGHEEAACLREISTTHVVIQALQADGWTITHDPLLIPFGDRRLFIDLGAERVTIGAERGSERIAVEIASFVADSPARDPPGSRRPVCRLPRPSRPDRAGAHAFSRRFHARAGLSVIEPLGQLVAADVRLRVLVFDPHQQKVVRWIN